MTLAELGDLISFVPGLGSNKVAYLSFPEDEAPELPFVTYLERASYVFSADNSVFYVAKTVDIELYTETRDESLEMAIESALAGAGIVWSKDFEYLYSERCYMIVYTVSI